MPGDGGGGGGGGGDPEARAQTPGRPATPLPRRATSPGPAIRRSNAAFEATAKANVRAHARKLEQFFHGAGARAKHRTKTRSKPRMFGHGSGTAADADEDDAWFFHYDMLDEARETFFSWFASTVRHCGRSYSRFGAQR